MFAVAYGREGDARRGETIGKRPIRTVADGQDDGVKDAQRVFLAGLRADADFAVGADGGDPGFQTGPDLIGSHAAHHVAAGPAFHVPGQLGLQLDDDDFPLPLRKKFHGFAADEAAADDQDAPARLDVPRKNPLRGDNAGVVAGKGKLDGPAARRQQQHVGRQRADFVHVQLVLKMDFDAGGPEHLVHALRVKGDIALEGGDGGKVEQAAEPRPLFVQGHIMPAPGGVERGGHAGGAAADAKHLLGHEGDGKIVAAFKARQGVERAGNAGSARGTAHAAVVAADAAEDLIGLAARGLVGQLGVRDKRPPHGDEIGVAPPQDFLGAVLVGDAVDGDDGDLPVDCLPHGAGQPGNPSLIRESWERCRQLGIPADKGERQVLPHEQATSLLHRNKELIEVAGSIMERLYVPVRSSQGFISLSDSRGYVLHALWNVRDSYHTPHLGPGTCASEESSGTNAIGICIKERRSVQTLGAEHYCRSLHNWFCAASPIWLDGNLVGILNISLPVEYYHPHTGGMIDSASHAISENLRLRSLIREQKATLEMLDEGVIVFDATGRIKTLNAKAWDMLGGRNAEIPENLNIRDIILSRDVVETLLSRNCGFRMQEAFVKYPGGSLNTLLSLSLVDKYGTRVLSIRAIRKANETAARLTGAKAVYTFEDICGRSSALRNVISFARLAAQSDVTTLILGESGTGKELFAQAIHNASARANRPFIVVNCGALPRELVQSELFGYDEGAFTGASKLGKPGKFELADTGTLFLDEIGEMPLSAQVSLLRLLQNGEVSRVGGKHTRHVDVRVIAATNRDLEEAIRENTFRADLFYRLNVFTLNIPPLRERHGDVGELIRHLLQKLSASHGLDLPDFSEEALGYLHRYRWPGNVRELENTLERLVHMAKGSPRIDVGLLPACILQAASPGQEDRRAYKGLLSLQEKETLVKTLCEFNGNLRAAAQELGLSRSGLYAKLKRLGISQDEYRKNKRNRLP